MSAPMNRIALVVIARNEARCIQRCLHSARAWVDEMWVLDTGSTDDTVALAAGCGAQVAAFDWIDDFSAARNAALALTDAPWRLVLDADEWIADTAQARQVLRGLRLAAPDFVGLTPVISQIDDGQGGQQQAPSWLPRVLPRGVAYSGRIHEQPVSNLRRRKLDLPVQHDGYQLAQRAAKLGRNRRLLVQALAEAPQDSYWHYQLGKDHEIEGQFEAAESHYAQAWPGCQPRAGWRHDLVLRRLFTLKKLARLEQAMQLAEAEMPNWPQSPDFYFTLGDVLLELAAHLSAQEPARAAELLPMIEASWLRAIEIGEQPGLQDRVSGRGSWLAAHNLAVFHASLGDADRSQQWRQTAARMRRIGGAQRR